MLAAESGVIWVPRVHWGLFIATYLFLGGVSGGSYVTSVSAQLIRGRASSDVEWQSRDETSRWGSLLSVVAIGVGTGALLYHLGAPLRALTFAWNFTNYGSWLVIGTWLIVIFSTLATLDLVWNFFGSEKQGRTSGSFFVRRILGWIAIGGEPVVLNLLDRFSDITKPPQKLHTAIRVFGAFLGMGVIVYTSMLLSDLWTCPLWNRTYLPPLFLMSGISTGLAATVAMPAIFDGLTETVHQYSLADDALIVVELGILLAFYNFLQGRTGCMASQATVDSLNSVFSMPFWVGVVGLGLLTPLAMSLVMTGASALFDLDERSHTWHQIFRAGYVLKYSLVLVGGFFLRYVIIFAAVKLPLTVA
ncbi:NrfD/PsrC family molybdoenzyme membrane anchor subunit [Halodesulfurarchaeum sp. HSR-GB]|uniref:Polysulfide reductase NrfD n=1 Tax=Halodesulfurarchaeum formicicum TaxID=1873524 RepID=A0A1J1AEH0_9EURY|nr:MULTISPECIES: NrfD/PsrC family molybdoenzyme membrane anchor subunit [Halodesulfurarchaeum]APE96203.1 polysulfide reductase NrfD [Halodesulfurarchaeum formicicum]MDR5656538.1 NrfD/PsrC family molybdoenzyme membrane anchor subunit [Halodesulfurarchaeum sp. HSR-GB]